MARGEAGAAARPHWLRRVARTTATIGILLAVLTPLQISQLVLHPIPPDREPAGSPPPGFEPLEVAGEPRLSCWLGSPIGTAASGTAIFAHGLGATRIQGGHLGHELRLQGLSVLLCDLRGHGESGDGPVSFGPLEAQDLSRAIAAAGAAGARTDRLGVVGFSLGGAVAARLARDDARVRVLVLASTFTSVRDILGHYGEWSFHGLVPGPLIDAGLVVASWRGGFAVDEPSTEEALRTLPVPALLVHGAEDGQIPVAMHDRLCAAKLEPRRCFTVPGAYHADLFAVGGAALRRTISGFVGEALAVPAGLELAPDAPLEEGQRNGSRIRTPD